MNASAIYHASNGILTTQMYRRLSTLGAAGIVALNLFRAQKCSSRAKKYGPVAGVGSQSYREMAYQRKAESLQQLSGTLLMHAADLQMVWGWGRDERLPQTPWVLYLELPDLGQVSFHSIQRFDGPDYPREWDGQRASESRILAFVQLVLNEHYS